MVSILLITLNLAGWKNLY